jgi:uncharacterized protein YlxP (DUF503 family)
MVALPISPDMMVGMIIGMVASPLLMKAVRSLRQKRRLDRLLNEIARTRSIEE